MSDGKQRGVCTHISKCSPDLFGPKDNIVYSKCNIEDFLIICCPNNYSLFSPTPRLDNRVQHKRISEKSNYLLYFSNIVMIVLIVLIYLLQNVKNTAQWFL